MDEEPLGDVLERYERSKALYKVLDAELKKVEAAVAELSGRVSLLEEELDTIRPKSRWELLWKQESEEIDPLDEERDLALQLAEEQYFAQCEKIEAEYEAKAGPIKERFKLQEDQLGEWDEEENDEEGWYKQNSPEYSSLVQELEILKKQAASIGSKRTVTRRELNASRDEKIRRLGK
jgi:hypothetical protein